MKFIQSVKTGFILGCCAVLTQGCGSGSCPPVILPGAHIAITDPQGNPVCGVDYVIYSDTGITEEGTTPTVGNHCHRVNVLWEKPGTYRLELRKNGYDDWLLERIRIFKDPCNVITAHIEAELTPTR